jgi:uncharacterized membrane protein
MPDRVIDLGGVAHIDVPGLDALRIRKIRPVDLREALLEGWYDFRAMPSHLVVLTLIYPILGLIAARWSMGNDLLPIIFPLISGFALVGPLAAVGLYEISRRREAGLQTHWSNVFQVVRSPGALTILALGAVLLVLFVGWLLAATAIYRSQFGAHVPASAVDMLRAIVSTRAGWTVILLGNAVGFVFAVVTLAVAAISFPLALDRGVGPIVAIIASVRAMAANPGTMLTWGAIVVALLVVGAIPLFVGLAVALPVLGHATWHLYRRVVV